MMIALGAALYLNRVAVMDWWATASLPELPVSVTFEQVVENESLIEEEDQTEVEVVEDLAVLEEDVVDAVEVDVTEVIVIDEVDGELIDASGVIEEEIVVEEEKEDLLPLSINLAVPFTPQAPNGTWGEPYQEGCEEASVYMVERYFEGEPEGLIEASKADEAILSIVDFENELFGFYEDTTALQTGMFAELMFGRTYELMVDPTVDQIKTHLAAGRPVIIPAGGRLLNNPYFTAPGPIYHMLVIRGYTEAGQFIVNDPGTYRGEAFLYDFDTILYAMHDWNGGEEITDGRKVALVIYP
ncbi:MAG: C39 family peptidase [Parcubacteria group bacterium]|nr:C39 family peptidase [Parcubacteria group bacterium]